MAVLCICGICIPYSVLWPIVLLFLKQVWSFLFPGAKQSKEIEQDQSTAANKDETTKAAVDQIGVVNLTHDMNWENIIKSDKVTVAKFTANWCKPCQAINPVYQQLSERYAESANFFSIDVDDFDTIAAENRAITIPMFVTYRNGKTLQKYVGKEEDKIQGLIAESVKE